MSSSSEISDATSAPADINAAASAAVDSSESSEEAATDWSHDIASAVARRNFNFFPPRDFSQFQSVFHMSRRTFEYICSIVRKPMILNTDFTFSNGRPMSLYEQVAAALRRLSSGMSLDLFGVSIGVNPSTVDQVTWKFVKAMERRGRVHLRWPQSQQALASVKAKFEHVYGLPNCCGAVDVTHILMTLSRSEPEVHVWRDNNENHSMVLMSIVDPSLRFLEIFTGLPGMMTDSRILQNSKFFQLCENGERLNGERLRLSERAEMQEYIIGDAGFPLLPWLMTPHQGMNLHPAEADFNRRIMAARAVSQKAFARLKQVWEMIDGVILRPDKHKLPRYIHCCILHNIIIDREDEVIGYLDSFASS